VHSAGEVDPAGNPRVIGAYHGPAQLDAADGQEVEALVAGQVAAKTGFRTQVDQPGGFASGVALKVSHEGRPKSFEADQGQGRTGGAGQDLVLVSHLKAVLGIAGRPLPHHDELALAVDGLAVALPVEQTGQHIACLSARLVISEDQLDAQKRYAFQFCVFHQGQAGLRPDHHLGRNRAVGEEGAGLLEHHFAGLHPHFDRLHQSAGLIGLDDGDFVLGIGLSRPVPQTQPADSVGEQ